VLLGKEHQQTNKGKVMEDKAITVRNCRDIVLTGLGRSGTTLACYLLNKLPDTVALAEPISPGKFDQLSSEEHETKTDDVEKFYRRMREMSLRQGVVISKHVGGAVPGNTKGMVDVVRGVNLIHHVHVTPVDAVNSETADWISSYRSSHRRALSSRV
jgi:hypothetical protein